MRYLGVSHTGLRLITRERTLVDDNLSVMEEIRSGLTYICWLLLFLFLCCPHFQSPFDQFFPSLLVVPLICFSLLSCSFCGSLICSSFLSHSFSGPFDLFFISHSSCGPFDLFFISLTFFLPVPVILYLLTSNLARTSC